jgi:hypothetical protein
VLAVILVGYLLVLIDFSILMVALPRIHHDRKLCEPLREHVDGPLAAARVLDFRCG